MVVIVIVAAMVVGVEAPVSAGTIVNVSVEALGIAVLAGILLDMFAAVVVTVLADVLADMLTEVMVAAFSGIMVGVDVSMLVDVESIMVADVSIVPKFFVLLLFSADMVSDVLVDALIFGIRVDVLVGVSVNIFAVMVTALRGVMLAPVETFSC